MPECQKCKKIVWPPSEFCNHCFGTVLLKQGDFEGKIIEFSRHDNQYFCIVEFSDAIKIIANISKIPKTGQRVKISECGIKDGSYFFHVS